MGRIRILTEGSQETASVPTQRFVEEFNSEGAKNLAHGARWCEKIAATGCCGCAA
jgi:hypothetical protein